MVLTTQYLEEADQLADEIIVLDHGRTVAQGSPDELKSSIGTDRIDVSVRSLSDMHAVADATRQFASNAATFDDDRLIATISVVEGTRLMEVMRALDRRGNRRHRPEHTARNARRRVPDSDRRDARHRRGTGMTTTTEAPQVATLRPPVEFARMERSEIATWWSDTCVFARRNIEHIRQIPEKLLDVTLQPLMFVLLFAYVFGGAIAVQGGNYREYIIGGILVQSLAFGLTGPATAISTDLTEGVIDRFRSLPATRTAYLSGHFLAELAGMCLSIVVLLTAGLVVGWRVHTDVFHVATALVLLLTFASAMIWIGTWIGLKVRSADAVMGIAFTVVFPLTFLSSAFVPIDSLPTGLQWIAIWNPITVMIGAVRELFGNPLTPVTRHAWPMDHADPVRVRLLRAAARDRGAGLDPALSRARATDGISSARSAPR